MQKREILSPKARKNLRRGLAFAILLLSSLLMLVPFIWMISSSLKSLDELFAIPPTILPRRFAFENYAYMWAQAPWTSYFINTSIITIFTIIGQIFTSSTAAYAFARLRFPGRNALFVLYLGTMMIPFQVVMIPQFKIIRYLNLINTRTSLILLGSFNAFGTFLLRQFFLNIPKEIEESAQIDGCSFPRIYTEIVMKNSKPAIMTLVIFTFMNSWNDFLRPLLFLNKKEAWTLALGLAQFQGTYTTQWNELMAGSLITIIPVLIVYLLAQKHFVEGIVMSGLKG